MKFNEITNTQYANIFTFSYVGAENVLYFVKELGLTKVRPISESKLLMLMNDDMSVVAYYSPDNSHFSYSRII